MMKEYIYEPLNLDRPAFRLLHLNRGSYNGKIRCSLFQAELQERDNTVSYEALSYTWGSANLTESIIVDGCYLRITSHLYVALRHLRHRHEDRILWIDAICINQGSKEERGHQVEQMSKIYKEADRVVFWLGPGTLETDALMESSQLLQRESIGHSCKNLSLRDPLWNDMWSSVQRSMNRSYGHLIVLQQDGLQKILKRPWFRRVWILQEVALAKAGIVLCGTRSVPTQFFILTPLLLDIKPDTHCQHVLDIMPSPWRKTSWWSKSPNLRTLLITFGDSEATESRDLVYALRGMSSDAGGENDIIPNYNKSEKNLVREVVQFVEHCELEDLELTIPPRTIRGLIDCLRSLDLDRCMALAKKSLPHDMEMLLERPEVKINQEIATTAAACDKTGEVFEILLRHRGKDFTISDRVLAAAAKNQSGAKGVFEALSRHQGGQIKISDEVLIATLKIIQCDDEVLRLFWTSFWDRSKIINREVLIAAAKNKFCGHKAIHMLFFNDFERVYDSDKVILIAAMNEGCGDEVLHNLLSHDSNSFKLSEDVALAAANNKGCGDRVFNILLSHDPSVKLSEKVALAAAENEGCGDKMARLIFYHRARNYILSTADFAEFEYRYNRHREEIAKLRFDFELLNKLNCGRGRATSFTHSKTSRRGQKEDAKDAFRKSFYQIDRHVKVTEHMLRNRDKLHIGKMEANHMLLELAIWNDNTTAIKLLLAKFTESEDRSANQIDIEGKNIYGQSLLAVAVVARRRGAVETLLGYGADVESKDIYGRTPLTLASVHKHTRIFDLILKYEEKRRHTEVY